MQKRIIITGGSGFIGTNLVDFYLTEGFEVLNLDIKPPRNNKHYDYWLCVDIEDYDLLLEKFNEYMPDYLVHMAARTDLRGKSLNEYSANILGVKNIINVCKEVASLKKVIFASSMLVCKAGYIPVNDHDYCPPNLYGESKMVGEELVRRTTLDSGYEWIIVRPTSIWGPWFGPTYRSFFEMILAGRYFNFSGKMSKKTYGYIGNVVYQINQILISDKTSGRTYYLGDYKSTNVKEWAREISAEVNRKVITIPRTLIWVAAKIGDILQRVGLSFPINSFRFHNMTTDNVIPMEDTKAIAPLTIYERTQGNRETIDWMRTYYLKSK